MNIKIRAFLHSVGMLAACCAGSILVGVFFHYFPTEYVPHLLITGLVVMLIYTGYGIALSRLEYEQRLKEINEKQ